MENNYCVYKHTSPSGKVYIGQTKNIKDRWKASAYKHCTFFYNAINKYGWENITHEILKDNLTLDEANHWEWYYIEYYSSTDKNYGYNIHSGGENKDFKQKTDKFKARYKEVYQYTLEGIFVKKWDNITAAAKFIGHSRTGHIISCCKKQRQTAGGYQWSYELEKMPCLKKIQNTPTQVIQKTKTGEIVKIHPSIHEAARAVNGLASGVAGALDKSGRTYYGYIWERVKEKEG